MATAQSAQRKTGSRKTIQSTRTPVAGRLLKDRAYEAIKERILSGETSPSRFLSERQLAADLSMSKTPIRAALERLAVEGFVTISPQQGIIVRDTSVTDIADQYEIRIALEAYVVRALAGRLTGPQQERLQSNLDEQERESADDDVRRWVELDARFHMLFCEFLGNQEILRTMGQLRDKIHRVTSQVFQLRPSRIAASYVEHCGIADAVLHDDPTLAAKLIAEHLERGKLCLLSPRDNGAL